MQVSNASLGSLTLPLEISDGEAPLGDLQHLTADELLGARPIGLAGLFMAPTQIKSHRFGRSAYGRAPERP